MKPTLLILTLICVLFSGCAKVAAMPQELAAKTQAIVQDTKVESTDVYAEIQNNIDSVAALKKEISESKDIDQARKLNRVIDELEKVTVSYEKLAARKSDVRKSLLAKVAAIDSLQSRAQSEMDRIAAERSEYVRMYQTTTDVNPDVVRTRKAALQQAVSYMDMQLGMWQAFVNTQQSIKTETLNVEQKIDSFLSVMESSAILFRQGLNLLKLQRDINDALSIFTQDLPRIEQLTRDMQNSWANLDVLCKTLVSMNISLK